ncbi:alpha/beta fold hydrolase [Acinetobacter sp. c3-l95]|uniref:alpha/beta fold hydrolase n=1 Tax=Acinetobacter sp. c3-l95 TaxID=3342804 RepID=UPI0035B6FC44
MSALIHFAHANGVPTPVYQELFSYLDGYGIITPDTAFGMHDDYAIDMHWQALTQQVIQSIEQQSQGKKVIAVGHSLGGILSLQAAMQRPDLIEQLILLDPPLFVGYHALTLHLAQKTHDYFVDKISPAGLSKKRRDHWENREQAHSLLRQRGFFKDFSQNSFDHYIQYALVDDQENGGVKLAVDKSKEVDIFRNLPSLYWQAQHRKTLDMPVTLIAGQDSPFVKQATAQASAKAFGFEYMEIAGGHMFPLQFPKQTATLIQQLILQNTL